MTQLYVIIFLSLLIAYSPFIKKNLLTIFKLDEIIFLEHAFFIIPFIIYCIYKGCFTKNKFKFVSKLSIKCACYLSLIITTSLIAGLIYYFLIKNTAMTQLVPILSPMIIIFTVLIGIILFNEKLSFNEILGIIIIIIGIYITRIKYE